MKHTLPPKQHVTKIGAGGRIVIPTDMRRALGLQKGDDVVLILEDSVVKVVSPSQAIERAQSLIRQYVSDERRLSEELIAERREEDHGA